MYEFGNNILYCTKCGKQYNGALTSTTCSVCAKVKYNLYETDTTPSTIVTETDETPVSQDTSNFLQD